MIKRDKNTDIDQGKIIVGKALGMENEDNKDDQRVKVPCSSSYDLMWTKDCIK